ncbi:MAG: polymer-forming cytoskeletal protein [Rhodospirillaceae bacterium]|jgi:cytoskeletal protein CcmA (bactofilin family)|nr:polymer-forming cytoskeletal protein [Rhodospirillaceae bacterium]MBT5667630.1 polymer-forming cytoskeletal protein [Rhodospirillaceae bacterium]
MLNRIIAKKNTPKDKAPGTPTPTGRQDQPTPRGTPKIPPYQPTSKSDSQRSALIGPGVYFEGTLDNCDEVIIDGTVKASIVAERMLVRENGDFSGTAKVGDAVILGVFDGTLSASTKLTVNATGRVSGDIGYAELEIAAGGVLTGDISVFDNRDEAKPHAPEKSDASVKDSKAPL